MRNVLIWAVPLIVAASSLAAAAWSPLLAWRQPVYIVAGFAGVIAMIILLCQPLLAGGNLPGLSARRSRGLHRWFGGGLLCAVVIHVGGLWVTSPPDVVDAVLFRSPTPFSVWGVIAMWAVFATALLAVFRRRFRLKPRTWQRVHICLALIIVVGSVVHALLIEGTMEIVSKAALCALALAAVLKVAVDFRVWRLRKQ